MTEAEWIASNDPQQMLGVLGEGASERKSRLFACACCRHVWHFYRGIEVGRRAIGVAEMFADGLASLAELVAAGHAAEEDFGRWGGPCEWWAGFMAESAAAYACFDLEPGETPAYYAEDCAVELAKAVAFDKL